MGRDGQKTRLLARTKTDSFDTETLTDFLKDLKRFVKGAKVILIVRPSSRPSEQTHAGQFLFEQRDWRNRVAARICARLESNRRSLEQHQRARTGQLLRRLNPRGHGGFFAEVSGVSLALDNCPFLPSITQVFSFDQIVTVLCEIKIVQAPDGIEYSDGCRYRTYYVPLHFLESCDSDEC